MTFTIRESGMVKVLTAIQAIGAAGAAVNGPIATWGSPVFYAPFVEETWRKGSGGARMFERGIRDTMPMVEPTIMEAIPKGAGSVGQAKRKIRDVGITNIKKYTPVKTGRLRGSIQEMSRPISAISPALGRRGRQIFPRPGMAA